VEWIQRLNEAIDYIENNLDQEINVEEAAKIAACSTFHFQRMFTYIAQVTLGEYIRRRRMTLAAFELTQGDQKIIDIEQNMGMIHPLHSIGHSKQFMEWHPQLQKTRVFL